MAHNLNKMQYWVLELLFVFFFRSIAILITSGIVSLKLRKTNLMDPNAYRSLSLMNPQKLFQNQPRSILLLPPNELTEYVLVIQNISTKLYFK